MDKDLEKSDEILKKQPLLLLSLAYIVSVVILLFFIETWYPQLLNIISLSVRIADLQMYKQMVAIFYVVAVVSILLQRDLTNKTTILPIIRKILVRNIALLAVLMPVLLLCLDLWCRPLLQLLWGFISDSHFYGWLVAHTYLFVSASLLSFLINIYLCSNPNESAKNWEKAVAKYLARPLLLATVILFLHLLILLLWDSMVLNPIKPWLKENPAFSLLMGICLLSILFGIHTYLESATGEKSWRRIAARFVMWPVLLLSVPVLVVATVSPEQLESLSERITENYVYIQIVVVMISLANVNLLTLFFLNLRNEDPKDVAIVWKILAYPVHFAILLAAKSLLLSMRAMSLALLFVILVLVTISTKFVELANSKFEKLFEEIFTKGLPNVLTNDPQSMVFTIASMLFLATALLMVLSLLRKNGQDTWRSLLKIKGSMIVVLSRKWVPPLEVVPSLGETWRFYGRRLCPSAKRVCRVFCALFSATWTLVAVILFYVLLARYTLPPGEWKNTIVAPEVKHNHGQLDSLVADHKSTPHPKPPKRFQKSSPIKWDTQFSLFYRDGNLKTKRGICPEGGNLQRLRSFKADISDTLQVKRQSLRLEVRGFASAAPVKVDGGGREGSDSSNLRIANERAVAIFHHLTSDIPRSDSLAFEKCNQDLTNWNRKLSDRNSKEAESANYDIGYSHWESYEEMVKFKPAEDDSSKGRPRQPDLEVFNRSVQIIIKEGDSWTEPE